MNPRLSPLFLLPLAVGCATVGTPPADDVPPPSPDQALLARATLGRPEAAWTFEEPLPEAPKGCRAFRCRDAEGRAWRVILRPPAAVSEPPAFVRAEPLEAAPEEERPVGAFSDFLAPEPEQRDVFAKATKGTEAESLRPEAVATQVVVGTNYDFRCVSSDGHRTFGVRIFRPLPHTGQAPRLISVRETTR